MDLSISVMLLLIFSSYVANQTRPTYKGIATANGAKRGFWAWEPEVCARGYAEGFSIKIDRRHGKLMWQDDSSINGIRIYCSDGTSVDSRVGERGHWLKKEICPKGSYLTTFALRVSTPQALWIFGDDAGVTNIKFRCSDGTVLMGRGQTWGKYGSWSPTCAPSYICGIRTRVDEVRAWIDISGLNDVMFYCCF